MLNKSLSLMGAVSMSLALSACGGSSLGAFDQKLERGNALVAKYAETERTPTEAMPTTGSATYEGVAAYSSVEPDSEEALIANPEYLSNVRLTATFTDDGGSIDGDLSDFITAENEVVDGGVHVTNGTISGTNFSADLSGNLALGGTTGVVDGGMSGSFFGDDAEAVHGYMGGTITDSTDDSSYSPFYAVFGAEKK
jgi:hypothetical protein